MPLSDPSVASEKIKRRRVTTACTFCRDHRVCRLKCIGSRITINIYWRLNVIVYARLVAGARRRLVIASTSKTTREQLNLRSLWGWTMVEGRQHLRDPGALSSKTKSRLSGSLVSLAVIYQHGQSLTQQKYVWSFLPWQTSSSLVSTLSSLLLQYLRSITSIWITFLLALLGHTSI